MLKSMTGYGKSNFSSEEKSFTIEIKTLNSKQLDANIRIPALFREKENEIRDILFTHFGRGKIECTVTAEKNNATIPAIDTALFQAYYQELTSLSEKVGNSVASDIFCQVLSLPDVFVIPKEELSEKLWNDMRDALLKVCNEANAFRMEEGKFLSQELKKRVLLITTMVDEITPFEENRLVVVRKKIENQLETLQLPDKYDVNRLEQELIYYLEKLDITEEKVRLGKHCSYFIETMEKEEAVGRKLAFITQEIGREINTIGSKCNDFNIQQIVVKIKDEVEKIKEQLANVL